MGTDGAKIKEAETLAQEGMIGMTKANAVSTTEYVREGVTFTREYFASAADNVLVLRVTSSQRGASPLMRS